LDEELSELKNKNANAQRFIYLTAFGLSVFRFFELSPSIDIEDRIGGALGFGFGVVILNLLIWLLTYIFHRKRWTDWHNDTTTIVLVVTILVVIGNIADHYY